jgi:hypothetical protein
VGFDNLLDDVEAEAGAAAAAEGLRPGLLVLVEQLVDVGGFDAETGVGHGDDDRLGALSMADDLR